MCAQSLEAMSACCAVAVHPREAPDTQHMTSVQTQSDSAQQCSCWPSTWSPGAYLQDTAPGPERCRGYLWHVRCQDEAGVAEAQLRWPRAWTMTQGMDPRRQPPSCRHNKALNFTELDLDTLTLAGDSSITAAAAVSSPAGLSGVLPCI